MKPLTEDELYAAGLSRQFHNVLMKLTDTAKAEWTVYASYRITTDMSAMSGNFWMPVLLTDALWEDRAAAARIIADEMNYRATVYAEAKTSA